MAKPKTETSTASTGSLRDQFTELLSSTLTNITTLEVRTYSSSAADIQLAKEGDPLEANTRLRAFTRIGMDGDTQVCVPTQANDQVDKDLWTLHTEAVNQARADRAASLEMALNLIGR